MIDNQKVEKMIEHVRNGLETNQGENAVLHSYLETKKYNTEHLVIDMIVWERDLQDFLSALKEMNFEKVIVINKSTALMSLLHFLLSNNCTLERAVTITNNREHEHKGLLLRIS